jgi:hypothetical protein
VGSLRRRHIELFVVSAGLRREAKVIAWRAPHCYAADVQQQFEGHSQLNEPALALSELLLGISPTVREGSAFYG